MTLRIVATPLDYPLSAPEPREGGFRSDLLPAFVPAPGYEALLERLRAPAALVVTTGQQPALFGGPLYTIYKALSAAAFADALSRRWGRPVAPVFWAAGDDHDFAEANHAAWLAADGSLAGAALPARTPDAPLTPMYREPLGEPVLGAIDALERDLPPSEFRDETIGWIRRHWRPDATVGSAFASAMAELLAPHGVLVLDSTHPAVKRAAAPLLVQALAGSRRINQALAARAEALAREGRDAGVNPGDGATLVMIECRMGRDRLVMLPDGGYTTRRGKSTYDLAKLAGLTERQPERFSPNVLLRPVVESALLPTVAYMGGPGELRYLPLTLPVYEALGMPRQQPTPRWSGVLVEARVDRALEKFGISLPDLMQPPGALEARLVRSRLPEGVLAALAELRDGIVAGYDPVLAAARDIDPTLEKPVTTARNHAVAATQDVEKKLVQHLKKRAETELTQIARARHAVWPDGKPQERVLTAAPFLARHGPTLLEDLLADMRQWYAGGLEGARRGA
ncbi:MAG TPA: bacillithiol biosynthesis cysteine-adding enzyme BshC [Gemmatimonadales bacterium]|nr:bacillithiol biosynthesis cysteine-adding enzyme BshC [Gemmatimonadales bacterium]